MSMTGWPPKVPSAHRERLRAIRLLALDVDGVLTDGGLFYGDDGQEYKRFQSRDGHGLKMLMATGITVAVITSRTSQVVAHRMSDLGIDHVYQGVQEKRDTCEQLLAAQGLTFEATAFIGDDVVDLPILSRAGFSIAPADAHGAVRDAVQWVASQAGGFGAVREACDLIMAAQDNLESQLAKYR